MQPGLYPASIAILIFLFPSSAALAATTIVTKMHGLDEYRTKVEAITALGREFLAISIKEDVEHMGAVLKTPEGTFRVSHGKSSPGKDRFRFSVLRPASLKVVAYWHTHGAQGPLREKFSVADSQAVRKTGLPFYLITPQGEIKLLHISQTGARRLTTQTVSTNLENI